MASACRLCLLLCGIRLSQLGNLLDVVVGIRHTNHGTRLKAAVHIVHGHKLILRNAITPRKRIDRLTGHHHMVYVSVIGRLVQIVGILGHIGLGLLLRRRSDLGLAHPQRLAYDQRLGVHVGIILHERRNRYIVVARYAVERLSGLDLVVEVFALALLLGAGLGLHLLRHGYLYRLVDLKAVRRGRVALLDCRLANLVGLGYRIERIARLDRMYIVLLAVDEDYDGCLVYRRNGLSTHPAHNGRR